MDGICLECRIQNRGPKYNHNRTKNEANIWKTISSTDCTLVFLYFRTLGVMYHSRDKTQHHRKNEPNRKKWRWNEQNGKNREKMKWRQREKEESHFILSLPVDKAHFIHIQTNELNDGLVSKCGVWVVIGFSWIFYSFRCCALSKCSKSISCSVWFASKNRSTHKALNAMPQMLPSRFIFNRTWSNEKKELNVCCEHVALILFIFFSFVFCVCVFSLLFFSCMDGWYCSVIYFAFIHIFHSFNAFEFAFVFGFSNALYVLQMNISHGIQIAFENCILVERQFFRSFAACICVEIWQNWMAHRNWTDLYYTTLRDF